MRKRWTTIALALTLLLGVTSCGKKQNQKEYEYPNRQEENAGAEATTKRGYLWIDAHANFKDYANSKENIERDLKKAKEVGFTDIVVDVRAPEGDILFRSKVEGAEEIKRMQVWIDGKLETLERTADWDYLQAFIDTGHKLGLRVHAGFNTMVGGSVSNGVKRGLFYRDPSKKEWATYELTSSGIVNALDNPAPGQKFFNPIHPDAQAYVLGLLKDLASYDLDGIILDRARYSGMDSDFSDLSREQFEAYIGRKVEHFPNDILTPGTTMTETLSMNTYPPYFKEWLEFRVKNIHDFMQKARTAVKEVNRSIEFGVYVGAWYGWYYDVGVNWASQTFKTSDHFRWATPKYSDYGYAELMDQMLIGAYASPLNVYGNKEWTMQGFCTLAFQKINGAAPIVAGGPDVGNWDPDKKATTEQKRQAVTNSVKACMDECNGYFLFDIIHIKMYDYWDDVEEGFKKARE